MALKILIAALLLSLLAIIIAAVRRRRVRRVLRRLAVERNMHFCSCDQLRLSDRVAANWPIVGAAYVRVVDLLYASDGAHHRYVFTAEYTAGIIRSKKRFRRAATFTEPRKVNPAPQALNIRLADEALPLPDQYRSLLQEKIADSAG